MLNGEFEAMQATYHENGRAMAPAAISVLTQHAKNVKGLVNLVDPFRVEELSAKYKQVPEEYIAAILDIQGVASDWTDELAQILDKHFDKRAPQKLFMDYALSPLIDEIVGGSAPTTPPKSRRGRSANIRASSSKTGPTSDEFIITTKGDSNQVDLHNLLVADGVKVALAATRAWWEGLGEDRAKKARESGFIVITGQGLHSAGGRSRMREQVYRKLVDDGWKVEKLTGQFLVNGRL
jgi:hypothetical protein